MTPIGRHFDNRIRAALPDACVFFTKPFCLRTDNLTDEAMWRIVRAVISQIVGLDSTISGNTR